MSNFPFFLLFIPLFLIGSFFGIAYLDYHSKEVACETWGNGTGREYRFVGSYPWYSDCLVKTKDGWISAYVLNSIETDI